MKTAVRISVFILFCLSMTISSISFAGSQGAPVKRVELTGPLGFIQNKGQFRDQDGQQRSDLLYMLIRNGFKVQVLPNTISFELFTLEDDPASVSEANGFMEDHSLDEEDRPIPKVIYKSSRIDLQFIGANPAPEVVAGEMLPDYLNYFLAFTPKNGITRVPQYNKITYKNLYNNIDLVMVASPDQFGAKAIAYDFIVHPGGNVNDIRYRYLGGDGQKVYENGTMETVNTAGKLFEMIPECYVQNEAGIKVMPVAASFKVENDVVAFNVNHFDKKQTLVIDPLLTWATYAGGSSNEEGRGVATDSADEVILLGRTYSSDGIATAGAYQTVKMGDVDVQIEKYTADCARIWGTYYGGSGIDHARGIIVNLEEGIYLGCHTDSPDGVATDSSAGVPTYKPVFSGGEGDDGVLSYFNKDGFLVWGTYFGGKFNEVVRRLHFDLEGNIVMVGYTESDSGIATPDAWQTVYNGHTDVSINKWTKDGQLIWSTYLGGENTDHGRSITVDGNDFIYINGSTGSKYGIAKNAFRSDLADGQDYLLAKYSSSGSLKWCSYWGGSQEDRGRGVYVNPTSQYVYYTGYSASDTGVATPDAYQQNWSEGYDANNQPFHDMVVMKWSTDGYPIWSTYLGGPADDRGRAITMIDEDVYVGGTSSNNNEMGTPDGFQPVNGGNDDMFLEKFNKSGNRIWGTYIGEEGSESTLALAVDNSKKYIYQVGSTTSENIATPGVAQQVYAGFEDCFLAKINVEDSNVGISTPEKEISMTLSPDPNVGEFSIKYDVIENTTLTVYDINGKVVYTKQLGIGNQKTDVSIPGNAPGLYHCTLSSNGKVIANKKFIIVK